MEVNISVVNRDCAAILTFESRSPLAVWRRSPCVAGLPPFRPPTPEEPSAIWQPPAPLQGYESVVTLSPHHTLVAAGDALTLAVLWDEGVAQVAARPPSCARHRWTRGTHALIA